MKAVALNILTITLVYGVLYSQMGPGSFEFKSPLDPFYFSFTTMSSVGYGDITPKTDLAKFVVMSQQFLIMTELAKAMKLF